MAQGGGHVERRVSGAPVRFRPAEATPTNPFCALHLRRVCGVCEHFQGPVIRCVAECGKGEGRVDGRTDARGCTFWGRR